MKLERVRERVEALLEDQARERRGIALSEMQAAGVGAAFMRASELFGRDRISEAQRALAGSGGVEEKRVRALLEFLVHGRARCSAAPELDQLLTWEAQASVEVGDRRLPLRRVLSVAAATADRGERQALAEARLAAYDEQTPIMEGYLARQRDAVVELGYGSYLESCEVLSEIDLRGLAREGERFLASTEAMYLELLEWQLGRTDGITVDEATEVDLFRMERAPTFERLFGEKVVWGLQGIFVEAGIDTTAGGRIEVETRRGLPGGLSAVCHPIRVPGEVVLTVAPAPGRHAHHTFLRALGVALHHAGTDPELPLESRWLGDESVPWGVGATFASLLETRPLLTRFYRMSAADQPTYLRVATLLNLLRVRREIGRLQAQIILFEEPDSREVREEFARLMRVATGVRFDPRAALRNTEPGFRVARRLRGEQLQAVLGDHLRERFDEDWYRNPRAGPALLSIFRAGRSFNASELAVQLSSRPLSFERLRLFLERAIA
jgi:hypothetical protein